jgi:hypothetical protein
MRLLIIIAAAVVVIAIGNTIRTKAFSPGLTGTVPAATTLSPYEIHLRYKGMKELPVHDSTNAY